MMAAESLEELGTHIGDEAIEYNETPRQLRAGGMSHWFIDLRRLSPQIAFRAGRQVLAMTGDCDYSCVAGIGVDGRKVVSHILLASVDFPGREGLEAAWGNDNQSDPPRDPEDADPERGFDPKNGYGFTSREVSGRRVLAVDGTFTTGDSMGTLVDMVRRKGGEVEDAAVIVDRSGERSAEVAQALGVTLHVLFEFDEGTHLLVPKYEPGVA